MDRFSDWSLVRSFLAVLRSGSLSAAARATGLAQPTVGRHVAQLETALGHSLFTRSSGGLVATQAAMALRSHAEAMEAAMAALVRTSERNSDHTAPCGTVRITASEIIGVSVLPAMLNDIRLRYPDIIFELVLNNRSDDLLRRSADIAVRMVRPTQQGLHARKVGEVALQFFAHRRYLERFGLPTTLQSLSKAHLIGFDRDDFSARSVVAGELPISRDQFAFRCDSDLGQQAAIHAGLGIGVLQTAIARRHGELVPVLADQIQFKLDVWLIIHEDQRSQPAIRAVFESLAAGLVAFTQT